MNIERTRDLLAASDNLAACFDRTLRVDEPSGKSYVLADHALARPIKRVAGLALPRLAALKRRTAR